MSRTQSTEPIRSRIGFSFSSNGRHAASIGISLDQCVLESWQLDTGEAVRNVVQGVHVEREAGVMPLDDGTLLLFQRCTKNPNHYTISALPTPGLTVKLGSIPAFGGYLLPAPSGWEAQAFLITIDDAERSTMWRLDSSAPCLEPVLRLHGVLSGGTWIDENAGLLALNRIHSGHRSSGIIVDLPSGTSREIWSLSESSTDRILCYAPTTRRIVLSSNASGESRLGWGVLGERAAHFPDVLQRNGHVTHALTFDDKGERLLVHETAGAISRLYIYAPSEDELTPLSFPLGTVHAPASWTGSLIRVPYSHPGQQPTVATIRVDDRSGLAADWSLPREPAPITATTADLVQLAGAAGPVEAIAYGGTSWRQSQQLVIALHGGPLSAWRFEFEPLFHQLASAGVAVLAPNYRGSTGYGADHLTAAFGNWGGPDLDDVRAIANDLRQYRESAGLPCPLVLGVSYGAFLALLAACTEPRAWSGCVALAPFLSAAALYEDAGSAVRQRIDELGMVGAENSAPQRDILSICSSLAAPLLLIHGSKDERIPVQQSRLLRKRLLELGKRPGIDIDYVEPDTDHAGIVGNWPQSLLHRITRFCLTRTASMTAGIGRGQRLTTQAERG